MTTPVHGIHASLAGLAVEIAGLTPDPRNARLHDERNIREVMESYKAHGQRKTIVVQRQADNGQRMVVRAGNGQMEAAKRLGWTHIAAVVVDENDRDAIRFAIRDNRTAELAEWDFKVLATEEASLREYGSSLTELGWTQAEIVPMTETTWFRDATGDVGDHQRNHPDPDKDKEDDERRVQLSVSEYVDFEKAAAVMRDRFHEPKMDLGKIVARLARHYLATLNHSGSEKPTEPKPEGN